MLDEQEDRCWVCDNHIYTLVFFSTKLPWERIRSDNHPELFEQLSSLCEGVDHPCWLMPECNWKPKKLLKMDAFLINIDKSAPNFIEDLKESGEFRPSVKAEADLNASERKLYTAKVDRYIGLNYYSSNVIKRVFFKSLRFRQPEMINSDLIMEMDDDPEETKEPKRPVYCFSSILKAGKHSLIVGLPDEYGIMDFYAGRFVVR